MSLTKRFEICFFIKTNRKSEPPMYQPLFAKEICAHTYYLKCVDVHVYRV